MSKPFYDGCTFLHESVNLWAAEDALKNKVPWITSLTLLDKRSKLKDLYIVWLDNMLREHEVEEQG